MRGAFVLFEGLPPTVIDSQVLAHVRLAREVLGIDITVIAVACSPSLYETSRERLDLARSVAGGEVHLVRGVRPALPVSLMVNRHRLACVFAGMARFDFIQARADYAAAVIGPWARSRGIPTLWDCRGDSRAELNVRLRTEQSLSFRYRSFLLEHELRIAGNTCTGALFVTTQLRDLMSSYMARLRPRWVIPCLAPEEEFFFDRVLRQRMRQTLAIADDEAVYVYSGSLISYQRFDETVSLFQQVLGRGQKARLIVLTPEVDRARQICAAFPPRSVICESVHYGAVNDFLNAADFGILLRDSIPVNAVAFPTKFAEYAMAGLKIIMKDSPPACVAAGRDIGNLVPFGAIVARSTEEERAKLALASKRHLGRRASMPLYGAIYSGLVNGDDYVASTVDTSAAQTK